MFQVCDSAGFRAELLNVLIVELGVQYFDSGLRS
jgi:hypothetical protein